MISRHLAEMHPKTRDKTIENQLKKGGQKNQFDGIFEQRTKVRHFPRQSLAYGCR